MTIYVTITVTIFLSAATRQGLQMRDRVTRTLEAVCTAGKRAGKPVGMFLARPADVPEWRERGATMFLLSSDHGFLLSGAANLLREIKKEQGPGALKEQE
jgi:2-keto-3-deoxy-L-rhamnonate aldolase RhmA